MHDIDVRERLGPTHRAVGPAFDLTVSKLLRPLVRPGTIRRSLLLGHLENEGSRRIVSVVAPAGYGKTTLLSQWAERNGQAFAWVSVDDRDNDPKVLLAYIAEALDAVEPVGGRVFDALASPASSVPGSVVPRLAAAFAARTVPIALVLDDVHLLRNRVCRDALSVLAEHVPDGSRLVLAGRTEPPLRISRLRAEGRILEIGPADLSLTPEEAARLLRDAGPVLGADEVAALHQRTEGWPAGLYLAALYLQEGGSLPGAAVSFGGDDRGARADRCLPSASRGVVREQRPARGLAGAFDGGRGCRQGRRAGGAALAAYLPASPGYDRRAMAPVAGGPGRDGKAPDGRRARSVPRYTGGTAGRGRAVG